MSYLNLCSAYEQNYFKIGTFKNLEMNKYTLFYGSESLEIKTFDYHKNTTESPACKVCVCHRAKHRLWLFSEYRWNFSLYSVLLVAMQYEKGEFLEDKSNDRSPLFLWHISPSKQILPNITPRSRKKQLAAKCSRRWNTGISLYAQEG